MLRSQVKVVKMLDWLASQKKNKNGNKKAGDSKGDKKEKAPPAEEKPLEVVPIEWEKNTVLSFTAFPDGCDREMIQEAFAAVDGVEPKDDLYIDYSRGESDGAVRFKKPRADIEELAKKFADGELKVGGQKVSARAKSARKRAQK